MDLGDTMQVDSMRGRIFLALVAVTVLAFVLVLIVPAAPDAMRQAGEGPSVRVPALAEASVSTAAPIRAAPVASADAATADPERAVRPVASTLPPASAPLPITPIAELMAHVGKELPIELLEGEREFATEPVDQSWAANAEAKILDRFVQMPGIALVSLEVECRTTMCLVKVASPDSPGAARPRFNILTDSIGLEPRWMMAIADTSGVLQSIAYLWREGMAPERDAPPADDAD
jgi:hypothetical protein